MDFYKNFIDIYESSSKNIIETFKQKKDNIEKNIGNLNTNTFYGIIIAIIILSILLPIAIIYIYNPQNLKNILFGESNNIIPEIKTSEFPEINISELSPQSNISLSPSNVIVDKNIITSK